MCFLSFSGPVSCSCLRRRRPRRRGQRRGRLGEWGRSGRRTLFTPAPADDIDVRLRAAERKPILPTGKMIKELCRESATLILAIIIVGKDLCPLELLLLSANVEGGMRDYLQKSAYYSPTSARIKNEVSSTKKEIEAKRVLEALYVCSTLPRSLIEFLAPSPKRHLFEFRVKGAQAPPEEDEGGREFSKASMGKRGQGGIVLFLEGLKEGSLRDKGSSADLTFQPPSSPHSLSYTYTLASMKEEGWTPRLQK